MKRFRMVCPACLDENLYEGDTNADSLEIACSRCGVLLVDEEEMSLRERVEREFGLLNGDIPAGEICPFLDGCGWKFEQCPTEERLHQEAFSCSAARLFVMGIAFARQTAR